MLIKTRALNASLYSKTVNSIMSISDVSFEKMRRLFQSLSSLFALNFVLFPEISPTISWPDSKYSQCHALIIEDSVISTIEIALYRHGNNSSLISGITLNFG